MLAQHKSDPNFLTVTPKTRRRRKLKKQQTTISRQSSAIDSTPHSSSLFQMLMNTKKVVQGIGYNVKHFLFDESRPVTVQDRIGRVWLLGRAMQSSEEFYSLWAQLYRMTYRRRWPDPILSAKSSVLFDSDTGWGCTIRSCQMMMARVLVSCGISSRQTLSLFTDRDCAIFSIQKFILSQSDKQVGEWFGPASVSTVLKNLLNSHQGSSVGLGLVVSLDGRLYTRDIVTESQQPMGSSLGSSVETPPVVSTRKKSTRNCSWDEAFAGQSSPSISSSFAASPRAGFVDLSCGNAGMTTSEYVSEEFWLIEADDQESETQSFLAVENGDWTRPVLLLVAIRLTPETDLDTSHIEALLWYVTLPSFVGILGGPDRRCHYIVGLAEETPDFENSQCLSYNLLSIDPHIVQDAAVTGTADEFKNSTHPSRIPPVSLCPSIAIGFLVKSQAELEQLREQLRSTRDGGFLEIRDDEAEPRIDSQAPQVIALGDTSSEDEVVVPHVHYS